MEEKKDILFFSIFRSLVLKQSIFRFIDNHKRKYVNYVRWVQGKDIIANGGVAMIQNYTFNWDFLQHYVPKMMDEIVRHDANAVITKYCLRKHVTVETVKSLLAALPDKLQFRPINSRFMHDLCVVSGNLEMVQFFSSLESIKMYFWCDVRTMDDASRYGKLSIVKYLHFNRSEGCSPEAMVGALMNGHLEVVRFLLDHRPESYTNAAMTKACGSGHFEIVKLFHDRNLTCTKLAMDAAATSGHLNIVKFLHFNRSEGATTNAMDSAAACGNLDVVRFLHFNRTEGATVKALSNAILVNRNEMVSFLHHNRSEGHNINIKQLPQTIQPPSFKLLLQILDQPKVPETPPSNSQQPQHINNK
ncbi:hypothetical protein DFA_04342 [Cavenderia fasciculata]|uniref:Ankyrin repeat-containing protein n=1 Tax=Cavenderia fasciculata TaxID=261658 RepID=F4PPB1_CACFS|nr:uncharacterized protein DFA_04342 [Cavenderia fasciculata]EGG22224.1 hypothetical protein DFA_04342 [Cavenderia fasciculata]|eukprot:XP_004360075.1 hypothetical protein DFA_04342 [Cavenderia fasciculata]